MRDFGHFETITQQGHPNLNLILETFLVSR